MQLANRSQQVSLNNATGSGMNGFTNKSDPIDDTTAAFMRATLGGRPPLPGAAVGGLASTPGIGIGRSVGGVGQAAHPHIPGPGGMAGRRMKPGLKLSQMTGISPTPNIGLGPGRPITTNHNNENPTPRRPPGEFGTPFASFSKIVYVSSHSTHFHTFP